MPNKSCNSCMEDKPLSEFRKNAKCKDGVTGTCKVCVNAYQKKYRASGKGKANREKANKNSKKWYSENKEACYSYSKKYKELNRGRYASYEKKRHAAKLSACPSWLTEDELWLIDEVYEISALRSKVTGVKHHVDHIVPLQGADVCGLHVPHNLQVLTMLDNIKKGNRHYA